jgi:hypothetical protein
MTVPDTVHELHVINLAIFFWNIAANFVSGIFKH